MLLDHRNKVCSEFQHICKLWCILFLRYFLTVVFYSGIKYCYVFYTQGMVIRDKFILIFIIAKTSSVFLGIILVGTTLNGNSKRSTWLYQSPCMTLQLTIIQCKCIRVDYDLFIECFVTCSCTEHVGHIVCVKGKLPCWPVFY